MFGRYDDRIAGANAARVGRDSRQVILRTVGDDDLQTVAAVVGNFLESGFVRGFARRIARIVIVNIGCCGKPLAERPQGHRRQFHTAGRTELQDGLHLVEHGIAIFPILLTAGQREFQAGPPAHLHISRRGADAVQVSIQSRRRPGARFRPGLRPGVNVGGQHHGGVFRRRGQRRFILLRGDLQPPINAGDAKVNRA